MACLFQKIDLMGNTMGSSNVKVNDDKATKYVKAGFQNEHSHTLETIQP
jgi:hypothetical protein